MSEPSNESKGTSLEIVHPNAAGIDIGNAAHYVAYRQTVIGRQCGASSVLPRI